MHMTQVLQYTSTNKFIHLSLVRYHLILHFDSDFPKVIKEYDVDTLALISTI